MSSRKKSKKIGLQSNQRGRSLCVYFLAEDEEMIQALSELAKDRTITSVSGFISQATRIHFANKQKELGL